MSPRHNCGYGPGAGRARATPNVCGLALLLALVPLTLSTSAEDMKQKAAPAVPLILHTWPWTGAAAAAWEELSKGPEASRLRALELAGNYCEVRRYPVCMYVYACMDCECHRRLGYRTL